MTVYRAVNRTRHIQEANRRKKAEYMNEGRTWNAYTGKLNINDSEESRYARKKRIGSTRAETHRPLLDPLRAALTACGCARPGARGYPDGPVCPLCKRILMAIKLESKGHGRIDVRF